MDISPIRLVILDLNVTIANTPFLDHKPLHALPGRRARLDALRAQGKRTIVASNQSPPLWRLATGDPKYASVSDLADDLYSVLNELGLARSFAKGSDDVILSLYDKRAVAILTRLAQQEGATPEEGEIAVATSLHRLKDALHMAIGNRFNAWISVDPDYRKPAPGILKFAMHLAEVSPADTLFVGDMEDDRQAAQAAGVRFAHANDFFAEGEPS